MRVSISIIITMALAAGMVAFSSCRKPAPAGQESAVAEIEASDSLPPQVKLLVKAVAESDSGAFAALVSYPLTRPYPLRDIADSVQMRHYFTRLVDDSLRQVITTAVPSDWGEYGWRGWTVRNGEYLWIDDTLYDIEYVSASEAGERSRLIDQEISSLPEPMRSGWRPVVCMRADDGKSVYRIDSRPAPADTEIYRLAIYDTDSVEQRAPALVLTGHKETEGSASLTTYYFSDENGGKALYEAELADSDVPRLSFTMNGKTTVVNVRKIYWRDLLHR